MPDPDYDALAYAVRTRSEQSATHGVTVCTASRKARQLFGGAGVFKRDQCAHDLMVAESYVSTRINRPELAAVWRGEDIDHSRKRKEVHPDAFLPGRIVEICGAYTAERIRRLVNDARTRGEELELW